MAASNESYASITKLTKLNYHKWLREVDALLGEYGLLHIVQSSAEALAEYQRQKSVLTVPPPPAADAAAITNAKEYMKSYHKVTRILLATATEEVKDKVDSVHPWELWTEYKELCQPKKLAGSQALILQKLITIACKDQEPIEGFISRIKRIRQDYDSAFPNKLDDANMNLHFLRALPNNEMWKSFKQSHSIYSGQYDDLTEEAELHELNQKTILSNAAVGATTSTTAETGASFSSGGFANYFGRPSYQTQAVSDYLTKYGSNLPDASKYNGTLGRGFPDVAAFGTNYPVITSEFLNFATGTSCSAPCFSGIVGLLNEIRLNAGKSPLGILNPLLYQHPEMFNDITTGNNPGCNTNGFYAAQAWDPVTGLGTPNYPQMATAVSALP